MADNVYKPSNSKHYYLRVSIAGKPYRESLQTTSQRAAKAFAKKRITALKASAASGEADWLFHSGFTAFYDSLEQSDPDHGWSDTTRKRYRTSLLQIGRTLTEVYSEKSIDIDEVAAWEISTAEISEFIALRREGGASIATINRDMTAFAHLMSYMKNKGWVEVNAVHTHERQGMKESLPDITLPTDAAIEKLADRAPGTLNYFPGFLNETGCRVTEAAMAKWPDISGMERPVEGHVKITLRNTKGGKVRTITLRQPAIDILSKIPRSNLSPYIFWNRTEGGYYRSVSNLFWDFGQETKFGARLHDLRHKFAIERLRDGWSVYRVQKYIGHGSVVTTERYYFRYLSQEQELVARADGNVGL